MYKQCKTEASAARQQQMAQQLLPLMLEKSYQDLTVTEICTALGITRNSFYRYFSDKDSMLHALLDQVLMDFVIFVRSVEGNGFTTQRKIHQIFRYWKNQKALLDALKHSGMTGVLIQRAALATQKNTMFSNFFRIREPGAQGYANMFVVSGLMHTLITWHHSGFDLSEEEMVSLTRRLLTEPLFVGE